MEGNYTSQNDDNSFVCFIYELRNHQMAEIVVREECPREERVVRTTEYEAIPLTKFLASIIKNEI
jgi:hypothetical protein